MLDFFNDETDQGKLFINYPMMESYRDCDAFFDENIEKAITSVPAENANSGVNGDGDEEVDALFYEIVKFSIGISDCP